MGAANSSNNSGFSTDDILEDIRRRLKEANSKLQSNATSPEAGDSVNVNEEANEQPHPSEGMSDELPEGEELDEVVLNEDEGEDENAHLNEEPREHPEELEPITQSDVGEEAPADLIEDDLEAGQEPAEQKPAQAQKTPQNINEPLEDLEGEPLEDLEGEPLEETPEDETPEETLEEEQEWDEEHEELAEDEGMIDHHHEDETLEDEAALEEEEPLEPLEETSEDETADETLEEEEQEWDEEHEELAEDEGMIDHHHEDEPSPKARKKAYGDVDYTKHDIGSFLPSKDLGFLSEKIGEIVAGKLAKLQNKSQLPSNYDEYGESKGVRSRQGYTMEDLALEALNPKIDAWMKENHHLILDVIEKTAEKLIGEAILNVEKRKNKS